MADAKISTPVGVQTESPTATAKFTLGTRAVSIDGNEYVYVQDSGSGVTGAGYVCRYSRTFSSTMLSTSNDALGDKVGVAPVAVTASYYFWLQIYGNADNGVRVLASATANTRLNTTATAGALDDDGTAGAFPITGIVLTTANGGAAAAAPAILNYPIQATVL